MNSDPNDPFSEFVSDREILDFTDESGREYSVEVITTFAIEDKEYFLTSPIHDGDYDLINLESDGFHSDIAGFCVLRMEQDADGEETLIEVLDKNELDEIRNFLEESMADD
jgi:uncharacterized protein YrzB (UPF0473 family)